MAKTLAVFGATGQQGGSVVNFVLKDSELSQAFKLRAITRDTSSEKSQQLKEKNVEVVAGDVTDRASLERALTGAHTVFAVTTPTFTPDGFEVELNDAKRIADAAVSVGVQYLIFSTLPAVKEISGGKYTKVIHFDSKAHAEKYIRTLPIRSAFVSLGAYMENFSAMPFFMPQRAAEDDSWSINLPMAPATKLPLLNAVEDTGKFVGAILADPDTYEGSVFSAATKLYTLDEIAECVSKATGKKVVYKQTSAHDFAKALPPVYDEAVPQVLGYIEEFGCFGPDTKDLVEWAAKNARGTPITFAQYLEAHPMQLS